MKTEIIIRELSDYVNLSVADEIILADKLNCSATDNIMQAMINYLLEGQEAYCQRCGRNLA